jgi:hypothetical protein
MGDGERTLVRWIEVFKYGGANMTSKEREIFSSTNATDGFYVVKANHVFVLHRANESSQGKFTPVEVGTFCAKAMQVENIMCASPIDRRLARQLSDLSPVTGMEMAPWIRMKILPNWSVRSNEQGGSLPTSMIRRHLSAFGGSLRN